MRAIENDKLLAQLEWRYAVKHFDPTKKISDVDWHVLEESIRLSPSSSGLQPWHFYVITDPEMKQRLLPASSNQPQITECSHLVVFASKRQLQVEDIDAHVQRTIEVRGVAPESLQGFRESRVKAFTTPHPDFDPDAWARSQVYIALGMFLASCAVVGVDACPMEGFEPERYDEILGIAKLGYHARVVATAGYRSPDDKYGKLKKVRFPNERVVTHI